MTDHDLGWALATSDEGARTVHPVTREELPLLMERLGPAASAFLEESGFRAEAGKVALLPGESGLAGAVLGLGSSATSPWPYGALPFALPENTSWQLGKGGDAAAATLGWMLGAYGFTRHKAAPRLPARLVLPSATCPA